MAERLTPERLAEIKAEYRCGHILNAAAPGELLAHIDAQQTEIDRLDELIAEHDRLMAQISALRRALIAYHDAWLDEKTVVQPAAVFILEETANDVTKYEQRLRLEGAREFVAFGGSLADWEASGCQTFKEWQAGMEAG